MRRLAQNSTYIVSIGIQGSGKTAKSSLFLGSILYAPELSNKIEVWSEVASVMAGAGYFFKKILPSP